MRTTEDVDLLIEPSDGHGPRVFAGLARREDQAEAALAPGDILEKALVKVGEGVEVGVRTHAWKSTDANAVDTAREVLIDRVRAPFLGLDALSAGAETFREPDVWDRARLLESKRPGGVPAPGWPFGPAVPVTQDTGGRADGAGETRPTPPTSPL